ncbi:conserved Plasmodium protein, unknown function [Plasmodium gallinaceum]|uniref:Uncharacterized protein n=1 Tax=Plasmodium gallinaceum TaxID=5849 RepID=A0A1J1GU21_PLAGA|nr:conserved Plasmodium protein, unknown function [Plasmodium gallinaceum]CRG95739.1 conserved Plasmodium protein, unknown function [Plasmodium gallinaceum]
MTKTNILDNDVEFLDRDNIKNSDSKEHRFSNKRRVIEEYNKENDENEFIRNLKKMNQNSNNKESNKLCQFIINYYEWDEIPTMNNLPYGLINKKNYLKLKNYNKNTNLNSIDSNINFVNKNSIKNIESDNLNTFNKQTVLNNISSSSLNNHYKNNIDENIEPKHKNLSEKENFHYFSSSIIYEDIKEYFFKTKSNITKINSTYITNKNNDKKNIINNENNLESIYVNKSKINIKKEDSICEYENNMKDKNNIENKSQEKNKDELENKNDVKSEEEINWMNDFISLTNIQILAKNTNKFNEWNNLTVIIPNIINFCCSPRSCICKNSFLTIKYICTSLKYDKINLCKFFVSIFPSIIKRLDIKNNFLNSCATKSIEEFMIHSNSVNNYEMLRLICSHSKNKNSSITKKMSYFVYLFLKNLPKSDLMNFSLSDFAEPFLNFINAKLEDTKKFIKQAFTLFLEFQNEDYIIENLKKGIKHKENVVIVEKQIRNLLKCNNCESLKKKYATFHEFKNMNKLKNLNKTSSFIF